MNSTKKIEKFTEALRRELHFALNKGEEMTLTLMVTPKKTKLGKKIGSRRGVVIPQITLDSSIGAIRSKLEENKR